MQSCISISVTCGFSGWSSGSQAPLGNPSRPALQAAAKPHATQVREQSIGSEIRILDAAHPDSIPMRRMGTRLNSWLARVSRIHSWVTSIQSCISISVTCGFSGWSSHSHTPLFFWYPSAAWEPIPACVAGRCKATCYTSKGTKHRLQDTPQEEQGIREPAP